MVAQKTFGRRPATDIRPRFSASARPDVAAPVAMPPAIAQTSARAPVQPSLFAERRPLLQAIDDAEFAAWKKERAHGPRMPWRYLWFTASLCFGIASFVLPGKVNDLVNWLLYFLMAASFYAGWTARRRKKAT